MIYFAGRYISHGLVEVRMCLPQFRHPLFIHSPRLIMRWAQNRYNNLVKQWHEPDGPSYSMVDTQYETRSKKLLVILRNSVIVESH